METKWEAKNSHKNFNDVFERGIGVELKRHITYFRDQIKLRVGPKKEVEKPWANPNTGCFSSRWPLLRAMKSVPKKLTNNFFKHILYSLKAHGHYFKIWRGAKLGISTRFTFTNLPRCSQIINSLITVLITLLRTTAAQNNFQYYNLMGLCFLPWNFYH